MNDIQQLIERFNSAVQRWTEAGEIDIKDTVQMTQVNLFLKYILATETGKFYDNDLNGMWYAEMVEFLHLGLAAPDYTTPNDAHYSSVHIPTYDALHEYSRWTDDWCITLSEAAFADYKDRGEKDICLLVRDDFRAVPKRPCAGFPNDSYGESILCVIIGSDGQIESVTNRWNIVGAETEKPEQYLRDIIGESYKSIFY